MRLAWVEEKIYDQFSSESSDNETLGKVSTVVQSVMIANTSKEIAFGYVAQAGNLGRAGAGYLRLVKGTGVGGSLFGIGISGYNIIRDLDKGESARTKDIVDISVGGVGLVAGGLAAAGLISNPIGWAIMGGIAVYNIGSLIYDLYIE